jgi:hypothetical protein
LRSSAFATDSARADDDVNRSTRVADIREYMDALTLLVIMTSSTAAGVGIARGVLSTVLHVMAHPPAVVRVPSRSSGA